MHNQRLIYIIQHSNNKMFKIGIATDDSRFKQLNSAYQINWQNSIYFKGENDDICKLERILHRLFYKHNLGLDKQDGYTEWFSIECIEQVIDSIIFNVKNSNYLIELEPNHIDLEINRTEKLVETVKHIETEKQTISYIEYRDSILKKYPDKIVKEWKELDKSDDINSDIKMNELIPELLVMNKPSELSQILFVNDSNIDNPTLAKISPLQLDLLNCIFYGVREKTKKKEIKINDTGSTEINFLMSELTSKIGSYKSNRYDVIRNELSRLSDIKIIINSLGKNKDEETLLVTRFILEMEFSKHRKKLDKKNVTLLLSNKLLNKFMDVKKYFAKMFLKIQFSMNSKYSKLLYELLKDYQNINTITIEIDDLIHLLNVTNFDTWFKFQGNVLKRAIKEINEKSDIQVSYEPIKEKPSPSERKQVTKIKFNIQKQPEKRLSELGLIEESITNHKHYNKSKQKLDKLVKNGYKVIDEDMWIETDINKNTERYDSEQRIDTWLKETPKSDRNSIFEELASSLEDCEDPIISIEDYKIIGVFSKDSFTRNPMETVEVLNNFLCSEDTNS